MARPPSSDDDAALRWDDLDDPSYSDPSYSDPGLADLDDAEREQGHSETDSVELEGGAAVGEHPAAKSVAAGVITALGALVFAAYSVAWVIGVGSLPLSGPTLLIEVLYQFAEFLAIIASALWFGTTVALTRGRTVARAGWLALGTLVLLPWPFVFGVIG